MSMFAETRTRTRRSPKDCGSSRTSSSEWRSDPSPTRMDPTAIPLLGGVTNATKQTLENIPGAAPGKGTHDCPEGGQEDIEVLCRRQESPV